MKSIHNYFCPVPLLLVLLIAMLTVLTANAQKEKTYKAWITLMDGTKLRGTLADVNEDRLVILCKEQEEIAIEPNTIDIIKIRRNGSIGRGAWIGAASGLVFGALVGYATDEDGGFDREYGALGGGVVGIPVGVIIGIGIGRVKKKIILAGDIQMYSSRLPELRSYLTN